MNILVLGATGRVGNYVVTYALKDGHYVTAFVRNPSKVELIHDHLTIFEGNALNSIDLEDALKRDIDVVISTLSTDGSTTLSASMPLVIDAMNKFGVKRIITIGTAGILQSRLEPELLRYQSRESKRTLTRAAEEHHKAYEILAQSDLDWTIVCPTYLPMGVLTKAYRIERNFLPEGGTEISVQDTAHFAYQQISNFAFSRSRVGIAY